VKKPIAERGGLLQLRYDGKEALGYFEIKYIKTLLTGILNRNNVGV
jgi:hypothetical protein